MTEYDNTNKEQTMNYNVSFRMPEGNDPKYKKFGKTKKGNYGPYMSICMEDMEEVLAQAKVSGKLNEFKGKHYFNCSMFESEFTQPNQAQTQHAQDKANAFVADDLDDEVPF